MTLASHYPTEVQRRMGRAVSEDGSHSHLFLTVQTLRGMKNVQDRIVTLLLYTLRNLFPIQLQDISFTKKIQLQIKRGMSRLSLLVSRH
jgi:hypothetical protein